MGQKKRARPLQPRPTRPQGKNGLAFHDKAIFWIDVHSDAVFMKNAYRVSIRPIGDQILAAFCFVAFIPDIAFIHFFAVVHCPYKLLFGHGFVSFYVAIKCKAKAIKAKAELYAARVMRCFAMRRARASSLLARKYAPSVG